MTDEIGFDWDEGNVAHLARHDVTKEEFEQMMRNEPSETDYEVVGSEERWTSVGHTNRLRILRAVWTVRKNGAIRAITAMNASKSAARVYLRAKVGQ